MVESSGASRVDVVPVVDKPTADNSDFATLCRVGAFDLSIGRVPSYLCETYATAEYGWRRSKRIEMAR